MKSHSEIVREIINKFGIGYINGSKADKLENEFTKAISTAVQEGRMAIEKKIEKLDPLLAICNWENSDDIAFAVQKYILKAIRQRGKHE